MHYITTSLATDILQGIDEVFHAGIDFTEISVEVLAD
jgi:hypothetical protein